MQDQGAVEGLGRAVRHPVLIHQFIARPTYPHPIRAQRPQRQYVARVSVALDFAIGVAPQRQMPHQRFPQLERGHLRVRLVVQHPVQRMRRRPLLAAAVQSPEHRQRQAGHRLGQQPHARPHRRHAQGRVRRHVLSCRRRQTLAVGHIHHPIQVGQRLRLPGPGLGLWIENPLQKAHSRQNKTPRSQIGIEALNSRVSRQAQQNIRLAGTGAARSAPRKPVVVDMTLPHRSNRVASWSPRPYSTTV